MKNIKSKIKRNRNRKINKIKVLYKILLSFLKFILRQVRLKDWFDFFEWLKKYLSHIFYFEDLFN